VIKLSFIGMSGADKSYWTRKLAASRFRAICIDMERLRDAALDAHGFLAFLYSEGRPAR
jgi:hypothetical protein